MRKQTESLGSLAEPVAKRLQTFEKDGVIDRLWSKDASLWNGDGVSDRLGWLTVVGDMKKRVGNMVRVAGEAKAEGFKRTLLLGMGGSSLCAEVLQRTLGGELRILDSTDPVEVRAAREWVGDGLLVVASKSGTTAEVDAFHRYFGGEARRVIAITDPGTPLANGEFRHVFLNPTDIGGRYSALSCFGLAPAALMGHDLGRLLANAESMMQRCDAGLPLAENPAVRLGVAMAEAAKAGRDKLTLVLSPEIASLGAWIEQLVAESTGKKETGILPIHDEPVGAPEVYGDDRLFVYVRYGASLDDKVKDLQPQIRIELTDLYDLGAEFFRWEFATAVAGAILGVNPFDQPDVQDSKELTKKLLERPDAIDALPDENQTVELLKQAKPGDYFALLAFLPRTEATESEVRKIRTIIRDRYRLATTAGFGPRYLHSTGQLFKGGANKGIFLLATSSDTEDLAIPGTNYGFSALKRAQALGDFQALLRRKRRIGPTNMTGDPAEGLRRLREWIEK